MILSREEAICLILEFSDRNTVTSPTKLNKLLARLNLNFIPIDIDFSLNKYGSYNAEISNLTENQFFKIEHYKLKNGIESRKFIQKLDGKKFFFEIVKPKIDQILTTEDFKILRDEINELSKLKAEEISDNEHKKLLVDTENRYKLEQKINSTFCDMYDLYGEAKLIPEETMVDLNFK